MRFRHEKHVPRASEAEWSTMRLWPGAGRHGEEEKPLWIYSQASQKLAGEIVSGHSEAWPKVRKLL
jgi:hypothetical protein